MASILDLIRRRWPPRPPDWARFFAQVAFVCTLLGFAVAPAALIGLIALAPAMALVWLEIVQPPRERPAAGFVCLIPFLALWALAIWRAPDPLLSLGIASFAAPGLALWALSARHRLLRTRAIFRALCGLAVLGAAQVIAAWMALVGWGPARPEFARASPLDVAHAAGPLLEVPNDTLLFAILAGPACALLRAPAHPLDRIAGGLTLAASLAAIVLVQSRAALLAFLVALCVFAVLTAGRRWRRAAALAGCLAVVAGALAAASGTLGKFAPDGDVSLDHGLWGRVALWESALGMLRAAPLLGRGAQSFAVEHGDFLPAWSPLDPEQTVAWAHQLFLETAADQGLLGLAALLLVLGRAAWLLSRGPAEPNGLAGRSATAAMLAAFLIAGALELSFERRYVALVMFVMISLTETFWNQAYVGGE